MKRAVAIVIKLGLVIILVALISLLIRPPVLQEPSKASAEWFRFYLPWDDRSPSFTDLSAEGPPAGGYGFVRVGEDGHFYLENGRLIRFWGVNIGYQALFPPKEVAEPIAKRLAKFGFNLVRVGSLDKSIFDPRFPDTRHFDLERLDRFDYLVSQLKENGIYIDLVLSGYRKFKAEDGVIDWDSPNFSGNYAKERLLRAMAIFDPYLNRLQREYARKLLLHRNPYTGNRYAEEPALAMLEIINETTLDYAWQREQLNFDSPGPIKVTQYYSDELDALWNLWLLERYGTGEELARAWSSPTEAGVGLLPGEDPARRTVRRLLYSERARFSGPRVRDLQSFYHQLQQQYFRSFYNFLRNELGVKVPISGTHTFHGMPNLALQAQLDFTGIHSPWEHPVFRRGQWFNTLPFRFLNRPMVRAETTPTPYDADWLETRNTIYKIAFAGSTLNRPLVVSEYNHPFPNEYQAEFPLLISAYGSLQDWDGIVIHSYMERLDHLDSDMITNGFIVFNDPIVMAQMPAASLLFRRGYVKNALEILPIPYTEEQVFAAFAKCGLDIHCVLRERGIDPHLALVHGVRNKFVSQPAPLPSEKLANPYRSDTGELEWDIERGLVLIDTKRVQAAVGFLAGKPIRLGNLTIQSTTDFAAISLISLDGRPIADSKRLLLTAAARMKNKGMKVERDALGFYCLTDWGEEPVIVQPVKAHLELKSRLAGELKVFRLDERGRLGEGVAVKEGEGKEGEVQLEFDIGDDQTLWYGITPAP